MKKIGVCLVSRYPPIKGGTASGIYWYARTLGSLGIEVHVITDATGDYRKEMNEYQPRNVTVHVNKDLAEEIVSVSRNFDISILDCKYIFPYGIEAKRAKDVTGLPLVMRHAGSDILKMKSDQNFMKMGIDAFKGANLISTSRSMESFFIGLGIEKGKITHESGFGINHEFFGPHCKPFGISELGRSGPVIGLFGKIGRNKGAEQTVMALSGIGDDYTLLMIPEKNDDNLKNLVKVHGISEKTLITDYRPPWVMPSIYAASDIVIAIDTGTHSQNHIPITGIEALNAGVCVVTNEETYNKPFFSQFVKEEEIWVSKIDDIKSYTDDLASLISERQKTRQIGLKARSKCAKHDGKLVARNMIKIYENMVKEWKK